MDELIDILDEHGRYTGKTCLKSEAHAKGFFHPTIHVWIYTQEGQLLLQKRSMQKKVFPGLWDISVAGHIGAGEAITTAAVREIKEEIDFDIPEEALLKIGTRKHEVKHSNGIIDNEYHHVFIVELTVPISQLNRQVSEVDALELFDLDLLLHTADHENILLPQYQEYYDYVHSKIEAQIKKR
jgi:isopentenyldiphosphate isomerase